MVKPWYFDIYHRNALIPHCTSKYTMDLPSKKTRYNGTYSTIYIQYIWLYLIFSSMWFLLQKQKKNEILWSYHRIRFYHGTTI